MNPDPLQEQQLPLSTEASLQTPAPIIEEGITWTSLLSSSFYNWRLGLNDSASEAPCCSQEPHPTFTVQSPGKMLVRCSAEKLAPLCLLCLQPPTSVVQRQLEGRTWTDSDHIAGHMTGDSDNLEIHIWGTQPRYPKHIYHKLEFDCILFPWAQSSLLFIIPGFS